MGSVELCKAVYANDLTATRAALAAGADLNARVLVEGVASQAQPPLSYAMTAEMTELLLDAGADIEGTDEQGRTALSRAASSVRYLGIELLEVLVRRGAKPTARLTQATDAKVAALLLACGVPITADAIFDARLDPARLTLFAEWPIKRSTASEVDKQLMLAARVGDLERVTALLRDGASPLARDTNDKSAIEHAAKYPAIAMQLERVAATGQPLILAVLDDAAVLPGEPAPAAAILAVRYRRHAALRALIAAGAKLEPDLVLLAIECGNLEALRVFLERGVAVDPHAALAAACKQADSDLLKELLLRGFDITPYPELWASNEGDRLVRNARKGLLPVVGPTVARWSLCPWCRELPATMGWCNRMSGNSTGEPLPAVTGRFETFGWSRRGLWKCPHCGTFYDYEFDHDGGIQDGWDGEDLIRISDHRALRLLRGMDPEPRIDREIAALMARRSRLLDDWLDARESTQLADAWAALGANRVEVTTEPDERITPHGAAELAAAILGWPIERLAWFGRQESEMPPPTYRVEARETQRCFLETGLDLQQTCHEWWTIREVVDGERGVQHVAVSWQRPDGTRDGAGDGGTVIRVFDRAAQRGAAIFVGKSYVSTIGEVDVSALDVVDRRQSFVIDGWERIDLDAVRGLLAQAISEVDAHFDVSPAWADRIVSDFTTPPTDPAAPNVRYIQHCYESGAHKLAIFERRYPEGHGRITVDVAGLPTGWSLRLVMQDETRVSGDVQFQLPRAGGKAVFARLATIPGFRFA